MNILKKGYPIKLYGECGGCKAIVETDAKESRGVSNKDRFVTCPTCGFNISVHWKIVDSRGNTWGGPELKPVEKEPFEGMAYLSTMRLVTGREGGIRGVHICTDWNVHSIRTNRAFISGDDLKIARDFFNKIDTSVS